MAFLAVDILTRLLAHPSLATTLQFQQVQRFLEFTRRIWPEIVGKSGVLPALPAHPAAFLSAVLQLPPEIIALSWVAFSDIADSFQQDPGPVPPSIDDSFRLHADNHQIGAEPLVPPVNSCPRVGCQHHECCTRYYPNYFGQAAENVAAQLEYYDSSVPNYIHIAQTSYVEAQLCVYFEMQMAMTQCIGSHILDFHYAHTRPSSSAEGIARIYNLALGTSTIPNASCLSHNLDGELVLDAFFYHAVLRDKSLHYQILSVPHHGT
ncbi:hypothetical protein C8R43DRAFT_966144 [Mycena crocata]|nr:hypothetical protein C8R43DRAFT_966144 [Mycena crocata]